MKQDYIIKELEKAFGDRVFTRGELFELLKRFDPDLKETTFRWQIYNLKKHQRVLSLSKNEFSLQLKPMFQPKPEINEAVLYKSIFKDFVQATICVWNTGMISEFMLHQPASSLMILEVEQDALIPVYNLLLEKSIFAGLDMPLAKPPFFLPTRLWGKFYIKPLISRAPIQHIGAYPTITIEKLIVDLFSEPNFYTAFAGSELAHIFNNMYHRYAIDFTKLFQYAGRRAKADQLRLFLLSNTDIPQNLLQ